MREAWALVRASAITASSYRLRLLMSIGGLLLSAVPLFFVTNALQDTMATHINAEADQYFGFVLVGTIALSFVMTAVGSLPNQLGGGITTGTLEALLSTRARLPAIFAGMIGFEVIWTAIRNFFLLVLGALLGAHVAWSQMLPAALIVLLLVLSMLPFGIVAAAMVLAFRTSGPLTQGVMFVSAALGGVYYPVAVIPSWIQSIAYLVPLSYGSEALRRVLLRGESLLDVGYEITVLLVGTVVLLAISSALFMVAFRYAKRAGTLTQY
ncbi:MAG: ABC transporter permease [Gemmatimonadota bacterium]